MSWFSPFSFFSSFWLGWHVEGNSHLPQHVQHGTDQMHHLCKLSENLDLDPALGMSIVSDDPRIGLKMSVNSPRSDILLYVKLQNSGSHTLLFENWTIRLDVGRKWDTLVPVPDPVSSTFWPCPLLNCLCSEEWLWASDDLSLTQRSIRPIMKQYSINMRRTISSPYKLYSLEMNNSLSPRSWIHCPQEVE